MINETACAIGSKMLPPIGVRSVYSTVTTLMSALGRESMPTDRQDPSS